MDYSSAYSYSADVAYNAIMDSNDGAPYQSPAHIEAWAAHTIAGQQMLDSHNELTLPNDGTWSTGAPPMPGYLSHSSSSDGSSIVNSIPMQRNSSSMYFCSSTDTNNLSRSGSSPGFPASQGLGFDVVAAPHGDGSSMDVTYSIDGRPQPIGDDVPFSLSPSENISYPEVSRNGSLPPNPGYMISSGSQNMRSGRMEGVYIPTWDDISVEPSVVSSLSSHIPDTPISVPLENWEDALEAQQSFANSSNQFPSSMRCYSNEQSTVKPIQGQQRNHLPEQWRQSPSDVTGQSTGSPISAFPNSRRSSDGEPLSARRHPLYKLEPNSSGFYKCIYQVDDKVCDHGEFKLKCNYDKHLDSHLKPYRCKQHGCAENPFSSTACLLRHEREAHGMHNHKEVLCRFKDCDRSKSGKGFPRKWNAHDHMKRVHHYIAPEDSTSNNGEVSSPSSPSMDMSFSEAPSLDVSSTGKRQFQDLVERPGNSTIRKNKPSAGSVKGIGSAVPYIAQSPGEHRFMEQDILYGRRCAQVSTDWSPWHQQYHTHV